MKDVIAAIFKGLAIAFDSVPGLSKLKGYRTVLGFVGLGIVTFLKIKGIGDAGVLDAINIGLTGFVALALNAKPQ